MIVDHLYVIPILASLDSDGDKKLETLRTAKALFSRHGPKAKTAAFVQISSLYSGEKFDSEVIDLLGDKVPLGIGPLPYSPEKESSTSGKVEKIPEGKQEQPIAQASVGIYLVFHSDGGGSVLMPAAIVDMLTTVIPKPLHAGITKISLFACDVADRGEGDPIEKVIGLTADEVRYGYKVNLIGGLQIMVTMLACLAQKGICPRICGYDVPVFAGEGPYKKKEPSRGVKKRVNGEWANTTYDDPDVYGRKLVIYQNGRQSLAPLKSREQVDQHYKKLHKKVLRINDEGKIVEALVGWSSKD